LSKEEGMELLQALAPQGNSASDWIPLIVRAPNVDPLYAKHSKRVLDFVGALLIFIVVAPLMLVIAVAITLDGGPAIFRHRRIGVRGRPFYCLKFRTMSVNAQEMLEAHLASDPEARAEWTANFKLKHDPRITRLGGWLRKSSLDELPQLFNVLSGEMSLVGPRPIVSQEISRYGGEFGFYAYCRPGLTGLWQISGRSDVEYSQRVTLDRQYVSGWSLWRDVLIILATPKVFLVKSGAY
jgi:Undecaprenyl-phosphate galactose phosphotransferase WbaP